MPRQRVQSPPSGSIPVNQAANNRPAQQIRMGSTSSGSTTASVPTGKGMLYVNTNLQHQQHLPQPKYRSGSEYLPRTPVSATSDSRSNGAPRRSPSLPLASPTIREAVPARNVYSSANVQQQFMNGMAPIPSSPKYPLHTVNQVKQSPPPSPTTKKRSPIVAQSLNFLKGNRNFSTSSLSSNNDSTQSQQASSIYNSRELDKYHLPNKQTTIGGRVIPQKVPEPGEAIKKNKSLGSLTRRVTSSASLRNSGDKNKFGQTSNGSINRSVSQSPSVMKSGGIAIYPALLSEVAIAFRDNIVLEDHYKNGIMYRDSFTGAEAVDIMCRIAKTTDRNLGIIIGRALDAQRFFHDVTYEHRIRDNVYEIYKFNDAIFDDDSEILRRNNSVVSNNTFYDSIVDDYNDASNPMDQIPKGVFTYLTHCYSPTCTRDKLCYSISCPRRLQQQMRVEMKMSSMVRSDSHLSFDADEQKQYWQLTVPKSTLDSLDKNEVKRQEGIFEVVSSEKAFVKDLEYIREFWIRPLSETKIIKDKERDNFIRTVFHNINEIWAVNHKFAEALIRRQQKGAIVESIADIFLEFIPQFKPFETYGAGQVVGKYEFDRQRKVNSLLRRFIEDTSKRVESKRLDLSSFLSKPTTRPARYPLLLKTIQNHTDPNSEEYKKLGTAVKLLENMLTTINFETGKQADKMHLFQLRQKLLFKPGELVDLKLNTDSRKLIYQCVLKKKGYQEKENQGEIHAYLFDHCLLFIKIGYLNKKEVYKVYQRPIPLALLFFTLSEFPPSMKQIKRASNTTGSTTALVGGDISSTGQLANSSNAARFPITFKYIGEHGYEMTLYATSAVQKLLASKLEAQTSKIIKDNDVFTLTSLSSQYFHRDNRINCVAPFDGGRKLMFGTDSGIYISDRSGPNSKPIKVISKVNIIQADILEEYQILLALNDKKLIYWPLDILRGGGDPQKNAKLGKELMGHVSFFKIGVCDGRKLVCAAKSSSNIVRIFEPVDPVTQKKTKKKFINTRDDLSFTSEPVSVSFLKTKLCIGCSKGFEIVSLSNGTKDVLLDPADTSLEFATSKEGLKPLEIDRINSDFLLSYSSFSFFINHNGWRVKPKWMIQWEGEPHAFALWYPYLLAFGTNFIEIRNVSNAELLRVIVADNIRFLHASSQEILYVYENEAGFDVVASLDFWDKSMKNRSRSGTESSIAAPTGPKGTAI